MFSAMRQASRASLPDETPMPCEHLEYAATAFSHCSTFGPRMKCWDSNTSLRATSISALMAEYCALRSRSGTFIAGFFFQRAVRFAAYAQFFRQWSFFVQIEASQNAGLQHLVSISTFRAAHDSVQIGRVETVAVTAHPAHLARRISNHQ